LARKSYYLGYIIKFLTSFTKTSKKQDGNIEEGKKNLCPTLEEAKLKLLV
jgi:hypothetical protein